MTFTLTEKFSIGTTLTDLLNVFLLFISSQHRILLKFLNIKFIERLITKLELHQFENFLLDTLQLLFISNKRYRALSLDIR